MNSRTEHLGRTLASALVLCTGLVAGPRGRNLVPNGDWEDGKKGQPAHWTPADNLIIYWDSKGGVDNSACLHFDTDVYRSEAAKHKANPDEHMEKTTTSGNKYNTVAGVEGVKVWSEPIDVEPGEWYLMQADCRGPGGGPFVYLKGFRKLDEKDLAQHGTLRWMYRHPNGPGYSLMVEGDEQRPPREGDYLQTFRARLVCHLTGDNKWRRFRRVVKLKSEKRYRAERVMMMPYAYWPPGDYYFDNIILRKITEKEAEEIKEHDRKNKIKNGVLLE